jgi:hypothetical protein
MITSEPHRRLCADGWEQARAAYAPDRWKRDDWREPFQLLVGALIYVSNALKECPEERFHVSIKSTPQTKVEQLFAKTAPPDFTTDQDLVEVFAQLHLASVSFRLPTAVFLVTRFFYRRTSWPLADLITIGDDLSRNRLSPFLHSLKGLGCCATRPLDCSAGGADLKLGLALVVAHRDEFAHGEIGEGRAEWNKERGAVFQNVHRCRLVEAQLSVIGWGLSQLSSA